MNNVINFTSHMSWASCENGLFKSNTLGGIFMKRQLWISQTSSYQIYWWHIWKELLLLKQIWKIDKEYWVCGFFASLNRQKGQADGKQNVRGMTDWNVLPSGDAVAHVVLYHSRISQLCLGRHSTAVLRSGWAHKKETNYRIRCGSAASPE